MVKVLLVEDNRDYRRLLKTSLKANGHEVLDFGNIGDMWSVLHMHPDVELAIIDENLEDCKGSDLISIFREDDSYNFPIVLHSGEPGSFNKAESVEAHFIEKDHRGIKRITDLIDQLMAPPPDDIEVILQNKESNLDISRYHYPNFSYLLETDLVAFPNTPNAFIRDGLEHQIRNGLFQMKKLKDISDGVIERTMLYIMFSYHAGLTIPVHEEKNAIKCFGECMDIHNLNKIFSEDRDPFIESIDFNNLHIPYLELRKDRRYDFLNFKPTLKKALETTVTSNLQFMYDFLYSGSRETKVIQDVNSLDSNHIKEFETRRSIACAYIAFNYISKLNTTWRNYHVAQAYDQMMVDTNRATSFSEFYKSLHPIVCK